MKNHMKVGCVVVAAGRGSRSGLDFNKVFYRLNGKSVLGMALDALSAPELIDEIALVLSESDFDTYAALCKEEGARPLVKSVVVGGKTRQDSVYNGLLALSEDTDIVLIHDAARPFVSREIIENVLEDAAACGSGVISTPVTDTIKIIDGEGYAVNTPERSTLRAVQTPQGFRYKEIMEAHAYARRSGIAATDDAALYEKRFGKVKLTSAPHAEDNKKLTLPADFDSAPPAARLFRTGTGYDVHRLTENRKLILCGVDIPYEKGLLGHSDADVALHALMDAMLGACAMGDIGHLFPDTDDRYKGISSMLLLEECAAKIRENGFSVASADITIVCQRPKLAPYIDAMRMNVAGVLRLPAGRISVKATTTEKLGFEGEGLGISAQAVATILEKI